MSMSPGTNFSYSLTRSSGCWPKFPPLQRKTGASQPVGGKGGGRGQGRHLVPNWTQRPHLEVQRVIYIAPINRGKKQEEQFYVPSEEGKARRGGRGLRSGVGTIYPPLPITPLPTRPTSRGHDQHLKRYLLPFFLRLKVSFSLSGSR